MNARHGLWSPIHIVTSFLSFCFIAGVTADLPSACAIDWNEPCMSCEQCSGGCSSDGCGSGGCDSTVISAGFRECECGRADCPGCGKGAGCGLRLGTGCGLGARGGVGLCGGGKYYDGTHCGMPAPSYPVPFATPRPTTPTYFTYPPLMPHNSLPHYRSTYQFRHGPGLSRTQVHWREKKLCNIADFIHHAIEIPR